MNKTMNKPFQTGHTGHDNIIHGLFRPTLLSRGWTALKSWQSRRIAIRELRAMPDSLLRDIGIERYQIKDAVNNFSKHPAVVRMPGENTAPAAETGKVARKAA